MDPSDVEKLRHMQGHPGWQIMAAMLEQRAQVYNRQLIMTPSERIAGYLEALMYVAAWPRMTVAAHDDEQITQPAPEPQSVGDPYHDPLAS